MNIPHRHPPLHCVTYLSDTGIAENEQFEQEGLVRCRHPSLVVESFAIEMKEIRKEDSRQTMTSSVCQSDLWSEERERGFVFEIHAQVSCEHF